MSESQQRKVISVRVDDELRERLETRASDEQSSVSQVVERVLRRELSDKTTNADRLAEVESLLKRLDGRHRADLRVMKELIGSLAYLYLFHTPPMPEQGRDVIVRQTNKRMQQFIRFVTSSLKEGDSVLNEEDASPVRDGLKTQDQETAA